MKKETRAKLICRKELPSGHIDIFEVYVRVEEKQDKKKYFEEMGYKVDIK